MWTEKSLLRSGPFFPFVFLEVGLTSRLCGMRKIVFSHVLFEKGIQTLFVVTGNPSYAKFERFVQNNVRGVAK